MVIAVTNLKGGVGKSTIATNLAVAIAHDGHSVCVLDTDKGQRSSSDWADARPDSLPEIAVHAAEPERINREVASYRKLYDFVIIDGTPSLSELADRTMLASDQLLIPVTPSIYDYRGFERFVDRFEEVQELKAQAGGTLDAYVILNRITLGSNVMTEIREALKAYDIKILDSKIVNRVAFADSASEGKGVIEYKDKKAAAEILALKVEFLKKIKENSLTLKNPT